MKKNNYRLLLLGSLVAAMSTLSMAYRVDLSAQTDSAFNQRKMLYADKTDFEWVEKTDMDENVRNAMKFLYAYMQDADLFDYPPQFYKDNVETTLKSLDTFSWGKNIPQEDMLHFVLPLRVNNEPLDGSRKVFFEMLQDRVRNMSMGEAILEVNHWCHEKVTYRPSDGRTSPPLSTLSQAIGRCGEESTFAVAALRSVGIPARQVYTPRWAHTDDNHAWVEVYSDGRWHFLGACEPEPVLDLAWFNAPSRRGMLMTANVFGKTEGNEEVVRDNHLGPLINVTSNYAPVVVRKVQVVDTDGKPVKNAKLRFCLYNYSEYFPLCERVTDEAGFAELTSGYGDLVAWGSDGTKFGFCKINSPGEGTTLLTLDKGKGYEGSMEIDLVPPPPGNDPVAVSEEQRQINSRRLAGEDSIRKGYEATFASDAEIASIAGKLSIDEERLSRLLKLSRGNHRALATMLTEISSAERETALSLLEKVSEKDLRDIDPEIVKAHVKAFKPREDFPLDFQYSYILNPRMENEALSSYKKALADYFGGEKGKYMKNPQLVADWIDANIKDDSDWNPQGLRISPEGVMRYRKGNPLSRKMLFVAICRSLDIPARIDLVRGEVQYASAGMEWHDVLRENKEDMENSKGFGYLKLEYTPDDFLKDPGYYYHFTISKIEDGLPRLLEFDEEGKWSTLFSEATPLETGSYLLTTGRRLANGGVLSRASLFNITENDTVTQPLIIRDDPQEITVIGALNAENLYHDIATDTDKSILSTTGRGYYVLGILRNGHEPSVHTINDISLVGNELGKRKEKILFLFEDGKGSGFNRSEYPGLPENVVVGEDIDSKVAKEIKESLNLESSELPLFVVADSFNRILYVSQGYTIGIGEQLLKILSKIED